MNNNGENVGKKFDSAAPMQVGGQAVIEGVMMRAPGMVATAVRRADGSITVRQEPHVSWSDHFRWLKLPIVRGGIGLVEMMVIGIRTLNASAEIAMQDAEPAAGAGEKKPGTTGNRALWVTVGLAFAGAMGLFFVIPLLLASSIPGVTQLPATFNLIAGLIRVLVLMLYLGLISLLRDVQRLFRYHGAEHKAVFTFERGLPLTVESARSQSRFHPRCGTSFLLIVMVSAIILFALLDTAIIALTGPITVATRLLTHLPLVPLVGGISYEFIKLSARHSDSTLGKALVAPGLWLQRITTKEPDEGQLEVALAALRSALGEEQETGTPVHPLSALAVSVN